MYGIEYTIDKTLQTLSRVTYRFDSCSDVRHPSIIVTAEPVKNAFIDVKNRGIKTRFITEITKDNLHYCKELMQVGSEVRHIDGVKGNFAVTDTEYVSYAISEEVRPSSLTQLVRSTSKEFVEQQQYCFETLWNRAIPAEQRIREIEEGIPVQTTEIIDGTENILNRGIEGLSFAKERFDNCIDRTCPSAYVLTRQMWDKCIEVSNKGVKLRFITEITLENISYCKEIMKIAELRHLDGIKGNFGITDGRDYRATATMQQGQPPSQAIRSTIKEFVEQQQYFFETLWNRAIPAKQRFKELEEGAKREFVETIRDPSEIQKLGFDLIKNAEEKILILFSTANAFHRQKKAGALELLKEAAKLRGIKVRILVPIGDNDNDNNDTVSERIQQMKDVGIDIREIKQTFQNKLSTLVVDQSLCLTVELKDDTLETSDKAIGLATYSNSEATVFSYVSIFENLWIQTLLHKRRQQQEEEAVAS
jgi:two-component system sensor histidine kinase VicK